MWKTVKYCYRVGFSSSRVSPACQLIAVFRTPRVWSNPTAMPKLAAAQNNPLPLATYGSVNG